MSKLRDNDSQETKNEPYEYIYRSFQIDSRDHLTNLPDLQGFLEIIPQKRLSIIKCGGIPVIVFFDLDGMKVYNSNFGLAAGDRLLRAFAEILRRHFGTGASGRFNADHFIAITSVDGIEDLLGQIFIELENIDMENTLPVSVGIYRYVHEEVTPIDACDRAKIACDANQSYGSGYTWFDDTMGHRYMKQAYILSHLEQALEEKWIRPCYQPVIRTLTGRLAGFEILARWNDPKYGVISPAEFVPVLESSGLSWKLDRYVARYAMESIRERLDRGEPVVPISINVSRADFDIVDPVSCIVDMMDELNLSRDLVKVEITESTIMNDKELMKRAIRNFHEAGLEVWMDDFGSGFSSLNVLKEFDFDEIKIDMVFLKNLDERGKEIITAVVSMAKKLGIHTLAEGVETEAHLEFLRDIGCEKLQGYLFSKPLFCEEVIPMIRDGIFEFETREQAILYEKVGFKNVVSDEPAAIFIDDGKGFKLIFENEPYKNLVYGESIESNDDVERIMSSMSTPLGPKFRKLADTVIMSGKSSSFTFVSENRFFRFTFELLGVLRSGAVLFATVEEVESEAGIEKSREMDAALRNIVSIYDSIYILDYGKDVRRTLISGLPDEFDGQEIRGIHKFYSNYKSRHIHPDDLERFRDFLRIDYGHGALSHMDSGSYAERFRVLQADGSYAWMVFFIMKMPSSQNNFLVGIRKAYFHEHPHGYEDKDSSGGKRITEKDDIYRDHVLWQNFIKDSGMKLFWKDNERKLRGFSESFKNDFGVSFDELFGKTEEDMNWSMPPSRYMDETRVLEHGEIVKDIPEQLLVDGILKNVHSTKIPIYDGEKITGLLGWFEEKKVKESVLAKVPVDKDIKQRQIEELTRGKSVDDLIIKIAKVLNETMEDNAAINKALELLSSRIHSDRLYVFEIDGWKVYNTYEWLGDGVESLLEIRKCFDYSYLTEWEKIISGNASICISDVQEHRWENEKFYRFISRVDIQRFIAAPLYSGGKLVGYLGAENYKLSEVRDAKKLLETVAYFIGDRITNSKLLVQMKKLGYTDALTGYGNRNALRERLASIREQQKAGFGIIYADLNGLKSINDTLGHAAGDKAICKSGNLLAEICGDVNVYRHGGDEFLVLLDDILEQEFRAISDRIASCVGHAMTAHMAVGFSWCRGVQDLDDSMHRAETRMYRDKASYYTLHDRRR